MIERCSIFNKILNLMNLILLKLIVQSFCKLSKYSIKYAVTNVGNENIMT